MSLNTETHRNGLSYLLKEKTKLVHSQTESASFIKKLFKGTFTPNEYYSYVWSLHQIYESLESSLKLNKKSEFIEPIYLEVLFRTKELQLDLVELKDDKNEIPLNLVNRVQEYSRYIIELGHSAPFLLVAHAYVRYLGDLSGGQILSKVLSKKLDKGLHFYDYPNLNADAIKIFYRDQLDKIGEISESKKLSICAESIKAFEWNKKVFDLISKPETH